MKKAHWFIIFLLFAISCLDDPDCFRLNNNVIGIAFKKMYDGRADTVALIGIQAMGVVRDTTFSKFTYTNGAYVPLDFFKEQTSLTLEGLYDTHHLVVGYDVKAQFVSDDCGARYVLSNLALLSDDYDSIRVVSNSPSSSEAGVHLEVYRCPRTNFMKVGFQQLLPDGTTRAMSPRFNVAGVLADTTLGTVNLPLTPDATTVRFDFNFEDYGANFLAVQYETADWNYKKEYCASYKLKHYKKLKVGNKGEAFDFDSVSVFKDSLQDPPVTNVAAYRCPETNLLRIRFRTASAPVRSDSLEVVSITDNKGTVLYENTELAIFTLPLLTGFVENTTQLITETEFTFALTDGATKKLRIGYVQDREPVHAACGIQTTLTDLAILSMDFSSSPETPRVDHTTFPVQTNFEIIK
jgi:hypothetical protein